MSAPSTEFERLAPVFGGMLGDIREQIHAGTSPAASSNKPLLILIDEAGQLELRWFPEEVSTIAGLGGMFVTGWQSKSQITARYGPSPMPCCRPSLEGDLQRHRRPVHARLRHPHRRHGPREPTGAVHRRQAAEPSANIRSVRTSSAARDPPDAPHDTVLLHGTLPPVHTARALVEEQGAARPRSTRCRREASSAAVRRNLSRGPRSPQRSEPGDRQNTDQGTSCVASSNEACLPRSRGPRNSCLACWPVDS